MNFSAICKFASGSASELDYHLLRSRDLGFLPEADYRELASKLTVLRKMLTSLLQKIDGERLMAKC